MVDTFKQKERDRQISERIRRGKKTASANDFEDYLAKLVEEYTSEEIQIRVDSPLSFKLPTDSKARTIYPDIALIRSNCLIAIIEAKIDLGFLWIDWASKRRQLIEDLMFAGEVKSRDGQLITTNSLPFATVILTAHNSRKEQQESILPANPITLLSERHAHPGDDRIEKESFMEKVKIDGERQEWQHLHKFITDTALVA